MVTRRSHFQNHQHWSMFASARSLSIFTLILALVHYWLSRCLLYNMIAPVLRRDEVVFTSSSPPGNLQVDDFNPRVSASA
ncbi:hypothetical protein BDQ17DRAFT_1033267 [Cyathus striatus]|nr:hypothetical protein BDQ17DRAFT_1033267 [Cyathus striatus]